MKKYDYPKNQEQFKRLILFAKIVMDVLEKNNIPFVVYGSFAHFFHTKDKKISVNDIDLIISKKNFLKAFNKIKKDGLDIIPEEETIEKSGTLIINDGKLKVELDEPGIISEENLKKRKFEKVDFYGKKIKIASLNDLEKIYPIAYEGSVNDKDKIFGRIKSLEDFLGRKLK